MGEQEQVSAGMEDEKVIKEEIEVVSMSKASHVCFISANKCLSQKLFVDSQIRLCYCLSMNSGFFHFNKP